MKRLGRGCLLIKLDVSAAYKQIPVRREDWPLLGFKWRGKYYYERVLPFGLRSSCRLWDLYASALHFCFMHLLKTSAKRSVIHYVDDFLFVVEPGEEEAAHAMLAAAKALCIELGLPLAPEKCEGPVTDLTFLGIELDTVAMSASLPAGRLAELKSLIVGWKRKARASVKELQSLTGLLNFACYVVRPGRFFLRRIIDHTTHVQSLGLGPHALFAIPDAVFADIDWWHEFLPEWNGISLLYEREWEESTKIELFTVACQTGYGGIYGKQWIAGEWSPDEFRAGRHAQAEALHAIPGVARAPPRRRHLGQVLARQEDHVPQRLPGGRAGDRCPHLSRSGVHAPVAAVGVLRVQLRIRVPRGACERRR